MKRLPVFLPMRNCPNRCIYCDQVTITGYSGSPSPEEVRVEASKNVEPLEVCFFGGSFTCQPMDLQRQYLSAAASAPAGSRIRLSTHPLCITSEVLSLLSEYPVRSIELGVSSLDDGVLKRCNRGYSERVALEKISLIANGPGNIPGAQLMTGLPCQDENSSMKDLLLLRDLKGHGKMELRIYPCLVLRGTPLEGLFLSGQYIPPGVDESARWAGRMVRYATRNGFDILRVGLQETPSLMQGVVAGPHHPALGELARSFAMVLSLLEENPTGPWIADQRQRSLLAGHGCWGFRELERLSGLDPKRARDLVTWTG